MLILYSLKNPYRYEWGPVYIKDDRYEEGYKCEEGYIKKEFPYSDLNNEEKNYINLFLNNYWTNCSKGYKPEDLYEYVWDQVQHLEYEVFNIPRNASTSEYFDQLPRDYIEYQEMLWFIFIEAQKSKDYIDIVILGNHLLNIHIDGRQTRGKNLYFIVELLSFLCSVDETDRVLKFTIELFKRETETAYKLGDIELRDYQEITLIPIYNFLMSDVFTGSNEKLRFLVSLHKNVLLEFGFTITAEKIKDIVFELDKELAQKIDEKHGKEFQKMFEDRNKTFSHKENSDYWDDSRSVWDDYDEDGVPYEDYD